MLYLGITRHGGIELMAPQRLLVVEDDPGVRTTIVTCLELEGYAVDSASSTKEAIDRLAAASYPIVISDIYIDDRKIRAALRRAELPATQRQGVRRRQSPRRVAR